MCTVRYYDCETQKWMLLILFCADFTNIFMYKKPVKYMWYKIEINGNIMGRQLGNKRAFTPGSACGLVLRNLLLFLLRNKLMKRLILYAPFWFSSFFNILSWKLKCDNCRSCLWILFILNYVHDNEMHSIPMASILSTHNVWKKIWNTNFVFQNIFESPWLVITSLHDQHFWSIIVMLELAKLSLPCVLVSK